MGTTEDLTRIAETLNSVETGHAARMAVGETANAVSRTYPVLEQIFDLDTRYSLRHELDAVRVNLDNYFPLIRADGQQDYRDEWRQPPWGFELCKRAYVVIAGIEGAAGYRPSTSNLSLLLDALEDAPRLFTEQLGRALGKVAEVAGEVAAEAGAGVGRALGGLGKGLGLSGALTVIIVVAVVAFVVTKGGIVAQVRALARDVGKAVSA
jgi:hypothetical protein